MRGEEAVGTPKEGEVEKIGEDGGDVEAEGFERRAHQLGVAAGKPFGAGACLSGAVVAPAYGGE